MIAAISLNTFLAIVWCLLVNELTLRDFVVGYVIGATVLYFARLEVGGTYYLNRFGVVVRLFVSFVWQLLLANLTVVRQVLSFPLDVQPGIIAYPLRVRSDLGITTLASLITLTPGTLSLDFSDDHRILYIHSLNVTDAEEVRASIRRAFEDHLVELERE